MRIRIVRPEVGGLTTGNDVTAQRWAAILRSLGHRVTAHEQWAGQPATSSWRSMHGRATLRSHRFRAVNVVAEALACGVPIVSSRIDGVLGTLGTAYRGYFRVGDERGLARVLRRFEVDAAFRRSLTRECHRLAPLAEPARERQGWQALLEAFRIKAAQRVLADPTQGHLGVAEMAYHVGYRSLATFNKGFKEMTGQTPTEYRASQQNGRASAGG